MGSHTRFDSKPFSSSFQSGLLIPKWDFVLTFLLFTQAPCKTKSCLFPQWNTVGFCVAVLQLASPSCPPLKRKAVVNYAELTFLSEMISLALLVRLTEPTAMQNEGPCISPAIIHLWEKLVLYSSRYRDRMWCARNPLTKLKRTIQTGPGWRNWGNNKWTDRHDVWKLHHWTQDVLTRVKVAGMVCGFIIPTSSITCFWHKLSVFPTPVLYLTARV